MDVLIVYGSQFGTTERLASTMALALGREHQVRVVHARDAAHVTGAGVDLLIVGAPTQLHGLRLLARPFLTGLADRGFRDVAAAAFDTRLAGGPDRTGAAADGIARRLEAAGCRLVRRPEGFLVSDLKGPLAEGEDARAVDWALDVAAAATPLSQARR